MMTMMIRVRQASQNGETQCKCIKRFYGTGPQTLSSGAGESYFFLWFFTFFANKKLQNKMSTTIAKIELSFEPELNFCIFGGLENEPPKALRRRAWLQHFPKTRFYVAKNSKEFKVAFFCALSLTCIEIQKLSNCISITFDFAKVVTFSKSVKNTLVWKVFAKVLINTLSF